MTINSQLSLILRICLGILVIFSHSFPLVGDTDPANFLGTSLGAVAVSGFFAPSGFLLFSKSLENTTFEFLVKRFSRIVPGLVFAVFATLAHAFFSLISRGRPVQIVDYVSCAYTNLSVVNPNIQVSIAGAFADNAMPGNANGSLWSLTRECWCYFILASLACVVRRFRYRTTALFEPPWRVHIILGSSVERVKFASRFARIFVPSSPNILILGCLWTNVCIHPKCIPRSSSRNDSGSDPSHIYRQ